MQWLSSQDSFTTVRANGHSPQLISLQCNAVSLKSVIPFPPQEVGPEDGGEPDAVLQWHGMIANRLLLVQQREAACSEMDYVAIFTSYLGTQDLLGDWTVLLELLALPNEIVPTRPNFIQSRTTTPTLSVYRRDHRGWNKPIYHCASPREAESLVEFLSRDDWNNGCTIGIAEPHGNWVVVQGTGHLARYPDRCVALEFAFRYAEESETGKEVRVFDSSGANRKQFVLKKGSEIRIEGND